MGEKSFAYGGAEFQKTLKVFGWTLASALVVLAIDLIGVVEIPAQFAFYVPIANTVLYALKEFIADNRI